MWRAEGAKVEVQIRNPQPKSVGNGTCRGYRRI